MIIILEGPDGSGKSRLARELSKSFGFPIIHRSKTTDTEEKRKLMLRYIEALDRGEDVIFDRCWYSEYVYGTIFKDDSVISYDEILKLESKMLVHGAMIIYCTGKPCVLFERCLERGETYVTSFDKFVQIKHSYDVLFKVEKHLIPILEYEFNE